MSARKGWAWGTTDSGEWLCIAGSAHARPHLARTPGEAVPYPTNIINTTPVLALVEDLGHPYYRILEVVLAVAEKAGLTLELADDGHPDVDFPEHGFEDDDPAFEQALAHYRGLQ